MNNHPCLSCGACCAFFKVSFHWSETLAESNSVPIELTLNMNQHQLTMLGTELEKPHCSAFKGKIGESASCSIYTKRPSCCRNFTASFEDGKSDERCDQARTGHGLALLSLESWA